MSCRCVASEADCNTSFTTHDRKKHTYYRNYRLSSSRNSRSSSTSSSLNDTSSNESKHTYLEVPATHIRIPSVCGRHERLGSNRSVLYNCLSPKPRDENDSSVDDVCLSSNKICPVMVSTPRNVQHWLASTNSLPSKIPVPVHQHHPVISYISSVSSVDSDDVHLDVPLRHRILDHASVRRYEVPQHA